jgi:hypothetical protein
MVVLSTAVGRERVSTAKREGERGAKVTDVDAVVLEDGRFVFL